MTQDNPLELVTVNEAARRLRCVGNTLRRAIEREGIKPDAILLEGGTRQRSLLFVEPRLAQLKKLVAAFAVVALLSISAIAQPAGVYQIFSGTMSPWQTNTVTGYANFGYGSGGYFNGIGYINFTNPANCAFVIPCDEYTNAGVSVTLQAATANPGVFILTGWLSGNGGNDFETVPSYSQSISLTTNRSTEFFLINVGSASHLKLGFANASDGIITNAVSVDLKSPKFGAKSATE